MKTTNLMIGLVAAAALAQVGVGAANAATKINFTYTTSNTVTSMGTTGTESKITGTGGGTDYFVDGVTSGSAPATTPTDVTLFTLTPESGKTPTKTATFMDSIAPEITITYGGSSYTFGGPTDPFKSITLSGKLSDGSDTVKFGSLNKPNKLSQVIGGYNFVVTLDTESNPGTIGQANSVGSIEASITASPAPEPSEIATLGLVGFGLLGLMVRARKATRVSGLAA